MYLSERKKIYLPQVPIFHVFLKILQDEQFFEEIFQQIFNKHSFKNVRKMLKIRWQKKKKWIKED